MPRANLDKKPQEVAAMFDEVAAKYDKTNSVLSLNQDRRWRQHVSRALDVRAGERVLDLAAGTGTSSQPFVHADAKVVACDFSLGMLKVGHEQFRGTSFVAGDALKLPFADGAFDAVTISFGIRNVVDVPTALAELRRVTRHGGRMVICEFSQPTWAPFGTVYRNYLMRALPAVAARVSSSPESYRYLSESIRAWPDQEAFATIVREAGWDDVEYRSLSGGIVALHRAVRP